MLAALGVVIPELLDLFGLVHFVEPVWWKVGYAKLQVKHWYSCLAILNLCSTIDHFYTRMVRCTF